METGKNSRKDGKEHNMEDFEKAMAMGMLKAVLDKDDNKVDLDPQKAAEFIKNYSKKTSFKKNDHVKIMDSFTKNMKYKEGFFVRYLTESERIAVISKGKNDCYEGYDSIVYFGTIENSPLFLYQNSSVLEAVKK